MLPIDVRHPALPDLFDPALPNAPMLFAILEGRLPGRAIADDPLDPRLAGVQSAEAIAFISRTTTQAEFDTVLTGLRRDAVVGLAWPGDAGGSVTPEAPAKVMDRLGFDPIPATGERLDRLRDALPAGSPSGRWTPAFSPAAIGVSSSRARTGASMHSWSTGSACA